MKMIDVQTYRCRIGLFAQCGGVKVRNRSCSRGFCSGTINIYNIFYILLYLIFILYFTSLSMSIISQTTSYSHISVYPSFHLKNISYNLPLVCSTHVKLLFSILVFHCMAYILSRYHKICSKMHTVSLTHSIISTVFPRSSSSRLSKFLKHSVIWCFMLNFSMITICNPSLLNPGPISNTSNGGIRKLSVFYQNVQGLIPFSQLSEEHPCLDNTKVFELNVFLCQNKPDVIVLNETWLKTSIKDNEVIHNNAYKIFRTDRTDITHPPDPNNPSRYRKNGGGVLIAIKTDLDVISKSIKLSNGAEISAIELSLGNRSKIMLCTCYRVGTLGVQNHNSISDSLRHILLRNLSSKVFVVGDFNLSSGRWPHHGSFNVPVERNFVDTFNELGFVQCINTATHIKGRTLDLLLTNSERHLHNVVVHDADSICKSDHFPITFDINMHVKRKKATRHKIYNFKHANWDAH